MANNVSITPGTGATISTDSVAGIQYQVVKLDVGGSGVSLPVSSANPVPAGGIRRDADTAFVSDLNPHPMMFNDGGRLKVSTTPSDISPTAGSITANGGIVSIQVKRLSNLAISMLATSLVGHNVSFEVSNNSTTGSDGIWYSVQVVRSNANTVEVNSGVLAATPAYMWDVNVSDYGYFRVRATAHTSGTAAYILNPSSYASEPIPAVQISSTQPISGSVTIGGAAAHGVTVSGNPDRIAGKAATANPTAVSNGQTADMMTDKVGRLVVVQGHTRDSVAKQATTITSSTVATTIVTAAGTSVFADITMLAITNGSATATGVTLSDGTISMVFNVSAGGGFVIPFNPPLPATTANVAWTLTCGTSVASIYVAVVTVKNI